MVGQFVIRSSRPICRLDPPLRRRPRRRASEFRRVLAYYFCQGPIKVTGQFNERFFWFRDHGVRVSHFGGDRVAAVRLTLEVKR